MNQSSIYLRFNNSAFPDGAFNTQESSYTDNLELEELQSQLATMRFIVQRLLTPVIVAFGVFGNLVNIVVLTRAWMKSSTNCYLTALAFCDILYLVFALSMSFAHYPSIKNTASFIHYRKQFGRPLVDTFSNMGVWLTLTFTMERYIGVCHPMKGMRWCTPQRARYIIVAVCVAAAIVTFPEFCEYKAVTIKTADNRTAIDPQLTSLGKRSSYRLGYYFINQALFALIPLALLMVFNSLLIRAVLTAAQQRKSMAKVVVAKCSVASRVGGAGTSNRQQSDQQKITIMLIVVVIVFLLCQLPQAVQKLYLAYLGVNAKLTPTSQEKFKISANILNLLVMINAACNFVLYSSFSTKFRRTFRKIFCHCIPGQRRSIPEILFTDMTSMNPSPPEESRAHLLRSKCQKGHYSHWNPTVTHHDSPGSARAGNIRSHGSYLSKNGYLEVVKATKRDGFRDNHCKSSAL